MPMFQAGMSTSVPRTAKGYRALSGSGTIEHDTIFSERIFADG